MPSKHKYGVFGQSHIARTRQKRATLMLPRLCRTTAPIENDIRRSQTGWPSAAEVSQAAFVVAVVPREWLGLFVGAGHLQWGKSKVGMPT